MERIREVRRSNMSALSSGSRRRRDSLEVEEGQMELQRASKRENDRDLLHRKKRCNIDNDGEERFSDDGKAEDDGGARIFPRSESPSSLNQNHRKILRPPRTVNQPAPMFKAADEMIGVPVPRKTRSASLKRSHKSWSSGNGGFGEDHRRASISLASGSTEVSSFPSFNVSMKKKMRPNGPKTRLLKLSKLSSSVEEDIEIEIAEVLFGLNKQPQSSKHEENIDYSWHKLESKETTGIGHGAKSSVLSPVTNNGESTDQALVLWQNGISESDPALAAQKKLRVQDNNSSIVCGVKAENWQLAKDEKISEVMMELNDASACGANVCVELQKDSKLSGEELCIRNRAATKEKSILLKAESASQLDMVSQNLKATKALSNIAKTDSRLEEKFKFNLMATPMVSSPDREGFIDFTLDLMPSSHNAKAKLEPEVKMLAVVDDRKKLAFQPRPKRCATHHHIARTIYLHQQTTKMNNFWPATGGSMEKTILGNPLQRNIPIVNLNPAKEMTEPVSKIPDFAKKENVSEAANLIGSVQQKQITLQQSPQLAPAGNILHGPAFIFPLNHRQSAAAVAKKSGSSKTANSTNHAPSSSNSTSLPGGVAAAMSFNYSNLPTNDTPFYNIVPNNGYPFPISTPAGAQVQAMPLINGSFYSPQMVFAQKQPHSQSSVQPAQQNTNTSSGLLLPSHKQPQMQHSRGAQVGRKKYLTPANVKLHSIQKQQQSRNVKAETAGESSDKQGSHVQKVGYGPNFTVPLQPMNFALIPSTSGEKPQQQSQAKRFKGGVELIPSQPFAMSFGSFNGGNKSSTLNFSSVGQNPAIFQGLPDMAQLGFQVTPAPQAILHKNNLLSDGKNGGSSTYSDEEKKTLMGNSPASFGQTLVFDNSARILNFVPSPGTGSWPPHFSTSTVTTSGSNGPQQHQILQLQKQQQQIFQNGAVRSKVSTTENPSASSSVPKFSTGYAIPSQIQSSQGNNNSAKNNPPISGSSSSTKNVSQQQTRAQHGHMQLSFAGNSKSPLNSQIQPKNPNNQSSPIVVSSTGGGNATSNSGNSKGGTLVSTIQQQQQTENSSASTGQNSSPVCGRNVPSILTTCPSHLSELKY